MALMKNASHVWDAISRNSLFRVQTWTSPGWLQSVGKCIPSLLFILVLLFIVAGFSSTCLIQLNLIPINRVRPTFTISLYRTVIPDNLLPGSNVVLIKASANNQRITYQIISGNFGTVFNVSSSDSGGRLFLFKEVKLQTRTHSHIHRIITHLHAQHCIHPYTHTHACKHACTHIHTATA